MIDPSSDDISPAMAPDRFLLNLNQTAVYAATRGAAFFLRRHVLFLMVYVNEWVRTQEALYVRIIYLAVCVSALIATTLFVAAALIIVGITLINPSETRLLAGSVDIYWSLDGLVFTRQLMSLSLSLGAFASFFLTRPSSRTPAPCSWPRSWPGRAGPCSSTPSTATPTNTPPNGPASKSTPS
jgi:hypothetical protein